MVERLKKKNTRIKNRKVNKNTRAKYLIKTKSILRKFFGGNISCGINNKRIDKKYSDKINKTADII